MSGPPHSMKLLVTGGAGFIGSAFVRMAIAETDLRVVNFDKLTYAGNLENLTPVEGNPRYRFVRADICDAAAVERRWPKRSPTPLCTSRPNRTWTAASSRRSR